MTPFWGSETNKYIRVPPPSLGGKGFHQRSEVFLLISVEETCDVWYWNFSFVLRESKFCDDLNLGVREREMADDIVSFCHD